MRWDDGWRLRGVWEFNFQFFDSYWLRRLMTTRWVLSSLFFCVWRASNFRSSSIHVVIVVVVVSTFVICRKYDKWMEKFQHPQEIINKRNFSLPLKKSIHFLRLKIISLVKYQSGERMEEFSFDFIKKLQSHFTAFFHFPIHSHSARSLSPCACTR